MVDLQTIVNDPEMVSKILEQQKSEQISKRYHCGYFNSNEYIVFFNLVKEIHEKGVSPDENLVILDYRITEDISVQGQYKHEITATHHRFIN